MRVLVTGGLGYLGSRVAHWLRAQNLTPVIGTRRSPSSISDEIKVALGENTEFVQTDFSSVKNLKEATENIDAILHFAGPDEKYCSENYESAKFLFQEGLTHLLESAKANRVSKFINISTAHVYGSPLVGHIDEDVAPSPKHPYGILNLLGEQVVAEYKTSFDAIVNIRISNSFGAPIHSQISQWGLLINSLCRQAAEDRSLVLKSSGTAIRDFIPIRDVCMALEIILRSDSKKLAPVSFNLGSGKSQSILEMAQRIAFLCQEQFGLNVRLIRPETAEAPAKANSLTYDCTRLKLLGFTPENDFDRAICETIEFCVHNFDTQPAQ